MDVNMPVMNGLDATKKIREQKKYADLPIIALTADALDSDRKDIFYSGMNDVVIKPIRVDILLETLSKWVNPSTRKQGISNAERNNDNNSKCSLQVHGIDTNAGLETCNNKKELYLRLLKKFIDEAEFIDSYKQAIHKGDLETAERLVHTLKGTAGNIGAFGIQQAALELQNAFRNKSSKKTLNALYKELETQFIAVIQALGKIDFESDRKSKKTSNKNIQIDKLLPSIQQLAVLLADDDTDATEIIERIANDMQGSQYMDDLTQIERYISRYDFSEALNSLNILTEKIKAA